MWLWGPVRAAVAGAGASPDGRAPASDAGALDEDAAAEGLEHPAGDGTGLAGADLAAVELHRGDHLGAGAGQETFVGDPDVGAGEVGPFYTTVRSDDLTCRDTCGLFVCCNCKNTDIAQ